MSNVHSHFQKIMPDEEMCVKFLKERGVLSFPKTCGTIRNGKECTGLLEEYKKKSRKKNSNGEFMVNVFLKCQEKGCETYHSARRGNRFFTSADKNGKCISGLSLYEIMELVWHWLCQYPSHEIERITKKSKATINFWNKVCRDVCVAKYEKREKMGGSNYAVQVTQIPFTMKQLGWETCTTYTLKQEPLFANDPYVICLTMVHPSHKYTECRFHVLERHDYKLIMEFILNEVRPHTMIITEDQEEYSMLDSYDYHHRRVNNSISIHNPNTGRDIDTLDNIWLSIKAKYEIKVCRFNANLNRQLKEMWWRSCIDKNYLFEAFIQELKEFL